MNLGFTCESRIRYPRRTNKPVEWRLKGSPAPAELAYLSATAFGSDWVSFLTGVANDEKPTHLRNPKTLDRRLDPDHVAPPIANQVSQIIEM